MADDTSPLGNREKAYQRFREDFSELMKAAQFRRFLWHLIDDRDWCKAHGVPVRDPATGQPFADPLQAYYHGGRQSLGAALVIEAQRLAPEMYLRMLTETMGLRREQPGVPIQVPPSPRE